jgi:hypothetical protein
LAEYLGLPGQGSFQHIGASMPDRKIVLFENENSNAINRREPDGIRGRGFRKCFAAVARIAEVACLMVRRATGFATARVDYAERRSRGLFPVGRFIDRIEVRACHGAYITM